MRRTLTLALLLSLTGCTLIADGKTGDLPARPRDGSVDEMDADTSDADVDSGDTSEGGVTATTIAAVRSAAYPVDSAVRLEGVVVTVIDTWPTPSGSIRVQDPAGGPNSGIRVMTTGSQVAALAIGDRVTIEGIKANYYDVARIDAPNGGSIEVTKISSGAPLEPMTLSPVDLAASTDEAAKWESVLVRFENIATAGPLGSAGANEADHSADTTGYFPLASSLTELTMSGSDLAAGTCLTVTGVFDRAFLRYQLLPRSPDDLVVGTGCATPTSIVSIQDGTVPAGTHVHLRDVIVTAIYTGAGTPRIWVADSAQAAAYNGILLFNPMVRGTTYSSLGIGDLLEVDGDVAEFNGLTELTPGTSPLLVLRRATNVATPVPLTVTPALFVGNPEPYESVLVDLAPITVTSVPNGNGVYTASRETFQVSADSFFGVAAPSNGACLSRFAGIVDYFASNFRFHPRTTADVVVGTNCPVP